ncbi:MAG: zinc-ribbon domain-containing protein [Gemmatimonadota bacterium]|nr:zinc-ribbon domain-containing protein [Gemmatimonadota bacterium]
MVITVTCPSCSTSFPVDPAKIPEGGVHARCSSCGDIFRVEKPAEPDPIPMLEDLAPDEPVAPPLPDLSGVTTVAADPPPLPEVAPPPLPELDAGDPFAEPAPFETAAPDMSAAEEMAHTLPAPDAELTPVAAPPVPTPPAAPAVQGFTFGKRDPTDKAKRLARVLVSDMIMYNAERHQSALAQGTLPEDFEEEIDKSWKEFVDQVGEELANGQGRTFWKDALNDILAKGEQVF